jgi:hypothetical protein
MSISSERSVSIIDAARFIYRTRSPSDRQVHCVYQQMKAGTLRVRHYAGPPLKWTTTEEALAEFLAASQLERSLGHQAVEAAKKRSTIGNADEHTAQLPHHYEEESEKLRDVYQGIWRDYFLALLLRRRMVHRSVAFHRAVIGGQVMLLVALVATFIGGIRFTFEHTPPEHTAIERWLGENTDEHQVTRWHAPEAAPDGNGSIIRVQYRYQKDSRRSIYTDRTFQVAGDEVTELAR